MGRSSSTGYPFFVQRADAGQFTYQRDLPTPLAPLVVGHVLLPWSGRTRVLAGKGTVKISLGTGDEKTARQRWGAVHPQVDALVRLAELRARGPSEGASETSAPRLDPAHIRRMAEQAYHDVLATDDRTQVEPGFVTPVAAILLQQTRAALPPGRDDAKVAELAARKLGQALISDVRRRQGIDYIEVTTLVDDEDGSGKSVKSGAGRRRIPLHATLIRAGFLDYVAFVKATGAKRLFPSLAEYRGRYTKDWSKWWGRWLDKLGMSDPRLCFHSFRHTFTAELRRVKCDMSIMKELLGHAQTDTTSGYGRKDGYLHELGDLNDELQRITFNGLNLNHLADLKTWRQPL